MAGLALSDFSDQKGLLVRLRGILPSLKNAERLVADLFLKHPAKVLGYTVAEAAAHAHVSEATGIRFCRTLGFEGYQDIKFQIARELVVPSRSFTGEEVVEGDTPGEVMQKVFAFNVQTLQETLEVLDAAALERASDLLEKAEKILVIGVGTSGANVQDAYNKLFRLGLNVVAQSDSHLQMMEASLLGPNGAVLAITHSGRTRDPVETLAVARQAGAKTVVITSNPRSPVTAHADVVLLTSSRESAFRGEAIASRLAQMSIVDALYTLIRIKGRGRAIAAEKKIEAVIGQKQIL